MRSGTMACKNISTVIMPTPTCCGSTQIGSRRVLYCVPSSGPSPGAKTRPMIEDLEKIARLEAELLEHQRYGERKAEEMDRLTIRSSILYDWIMRGRTRAQAEMIISGAWREWKPRTIRRKLRRSWP